jgi:translation initiation factor eIF-2B subunit alpha
MSTLTENDTPHPVVKHFSDVYKSTYHEDSLSIIAIKALLLVIKNSTAATMMGLHDDLQSATKALKAHAEAQGVLQKFGRSSVLSLQSGCELFVRYVSRTFVDFPGNFEECKTNLLNRGTKFAELSLLSREKIAELGHPFVRDGATVLTHGLSRVVAEVLLKAAREGKQFNVVLTECSGGPSDERMGIENQAALFRRSGIPVTLVPDCAVASIIEQVDMAIVGAEAVVESGGVINRTGTYQIGIICKATATPLYVAAESLKFARLYPLNQQDLPTPCITNPPNSRKTWEILSSPGVELHAPKCDFTAPGYITLLFTDLGVLTPAAVSDELIQLYQ